MDIIISLLVFGILFILLTILFVRLIYEKATDNMTKKEIEEYNRAIGYYNSSNGVGYSFRK